MMGSGVAQRWDRFTEAYSFFERMGFFFVITFKLMEKGRTKMNKSRVFIIALAIVFAVDGMAYADLNDGLVAYYPFN